MFEWVDALSERWIDWRYKQVARRDKDLVDDNDVKVVRYSADVNGVDLMLCHPHVAKIAADAVAMLEEGEADNYLEFNLRPRPTDGARWITLTVQYSSGMSPAQKVAMLQKRLDEIESYN